MIRFLAEISETLEGYTLFTPAGTGINNHSLHGVIYYLDINEYPQNSYWLDWGGSFGDTLKGTNITLYLGFFLERVNDLNNLLTTPSSYFVNTDTRIVYINTPTHPWLYAPYSSSAETLHPYLSAPLNPNDPSNNVLKETNTNVRLEVPNFSVKLSDNIAGIVLNQSFNITLHNNDGYFDDEERMNIFNTPLYLRKAVIENPQFGDFEIIRRGLVENVETTFDRVTISVGDRFRVLEEQVCRLIEAEHFPEIESIEDNAINKPIPIVYGRKRIPLLKLNDNQYITGENVTGVLTVYDRDGMAFPPNSTIQTINNTGVITTNHSFELREAIVENNATPSEGNNIGRIIYHILTTKADMNYNSDNFNIDEFDWYMINSPKVNIAITGGSIRKAIEDILKNDTAFFIQQNRGHFTIRQYGRQYNEIQIPTWQITRQPTKNYSNAQRNYFSSCVINWTDFSDRLGGNANRIKYEYEL